MADSVAELRALIAQYALFLSAKNLRALGSLHWQNEDFTHIWSPGEIDRGWESYALRLERELERLQEPVFRFDDVRATVIDGRFATVTARWRCEYGMGEERRIAREGSVLFAVTKRGDAWQIVADHFSQS